jgi:hypothetical protein
MEYIYILTTFPEAKRDSVLEEDAQTFEDILGQYADLCRSDPVTPAAPESDRNHPATTAPTASTSPRHQVNTAEQADSMKIPC